MNRRFRGRFALLLVSLFLLIANPAWASQAASLAQPAPPQPFISPFVVGSLITSQQKIIAQDGQAGDHFGCSVAISGDTALVGAYDAADSAGKAYVYVRSGTTWMQQAVLTAADGRSGDQFGVAVALSGDTALIGADGAALKPGLGQGAAYIFVRSGASWTQQQKLTASDPADFDHFGSAVALSGDTALVGVPHDLVDDHANQGSVYVFARSGTAWSQQAHLTASDGAAADWFGYAVALSGDIALVGAAVDDIAAQYDQGSAYIFTRNGAVWTQSAKLTVAEGMKEDRLGYAVALAGDTALVSAVNVDSGKSAVYVFVGSGSSWNRQAQWTVAGGANYDNFGQSVALAGEMALVGARPTNGSLGSAYPFTRTDGAWLQEAQLFASDGTSSDQFGSSVSLSGPWALVGAPNATVGSHLYQGAAYLYHFSPLIPTYPTYLPLVVN